MAKQSREDRLRRKHENRTSKVAGDSATKGTTNELFTCGRAE